MQGKAERRNSNKRMEVDTENCRRFAIAVITASQLFFSLKGIYMNKPIALSIALFLISLSFSPEWFKSAFAQERNNMTKDQIVELVESLEAEINNGGFDQFFFNSSGDKTADTIAALEAIGAKHTADIVRQAASKFPNGMPSTDRTLRQYQLEKISPDGEAFETQDNAFYEYKDNLAALIKAFKG